MGILKNLNETPNDYVQNIEIAIQNLEIFRLKLNIEPDQDYSNTNKDVEINFSINISFDPDKCSLISFTQ